jgi:tungstate transport system ATP-binding protein
MNEARRADPIYRLKNLTKVYDGRLVLNIESLEIYRGEVLALVGPSGSGKSTLLRVLNFLEPPNLGSIEFEGRVYNPDQSPELEMRRWVVTVFQRPMLLNRSVWDNVAYGLRLRGERDVKPRVQQALVQVGLDALARQRASTLSGGEAQRVALARALAIRPKVLLLDEPTANLDPYNVGLIEGIIQRLNREQGISLVLVTHNIFQARRLAQRVVFLLDGKIIEAADTEQFFESPHEARTRAFIRGEMVY